MQTKTIDQTIKINAPAEKVWQVLWDKDTYKEWSAAYMPGSHYTGEVKNGGKIQFLDPKNNGMESEVVSFTENEEVTFRHLHELEEGKQGKSLNGWEEKYTLDEKDGVTTLRMTQDMDEKYFDEMNSATEKAFKTVKELAENRKADLELS